MNKAIIFLVSFVFFPGVIKSMDDVADQKRTADVRVNMQGDNPRLSLKLPVSAGSRRFMKSSGGSGGSSTPGKSGKSTVRCNDDLSCQIKAQRAASVRTLKKKTITSTKPISKDELSGLVDDEESIEVVDLATKKRSVFLPRKVAEQVVSTPLPQSNAYVADEKFYTEEEVWEGLKIVNHRLYCLGKARNITLEDLMIYKTVVENNDLEHDYVMEAIGKKLGDQGAATAPLTIWSAVGNLFSFGSSSQRQDAAINPAWSALYEKIKNKDPKSYELVLFEIMKELESSPSNSAITDLHTNLQNQAIQESNESLKKTILTTIASLLLTAATTAWGIYGQTSSTAGLPANCTG